jgi:uncharacterized protein
MLRLISRSTATATQGISNAVANTNTLFSKVQMDLKSAMLEKNKLKAGVLKTLLSELKYAQKSPNPTDLFACLRKQIKQREESIQTFKSINRNDLVDKEMQEIEIVKAYLPQQLTAEEIELKIADILKTIPESDLKSMGKIMKVVSSNAELDSSIAPKSIVAAVVKRILQK